MKFLFEDENQIQICKFRKSDLKSTDKGLIIIGSDTYSHNLRLPALSNRKHFIRANQIADYGEYVYIPKDQLPDADMIFDYVKPVKVKIIPKYMWKSMKDSHPYGG